MPRRRTSIKRKRADKKRHLRNLTIKTQLKKSLKQFRQLLTSKKASEAKTLLSKIFSQLDKAAKKKVLHRKTASRDKSRLSKRLFKVT